MIIPTKQRRVGPGRQKLVEPTDEAKKPKSKEGIDDSDDLKNGKEVERVYSKLKSIFDKTKEPVPFFKAMVKPDSFCETVEGIFYSAFLIKEGVVSAKLMKTSNGYVPVIEPEDPEEVERCHERVRERRNNENDSEDESEETSASSHQSILSFCEDDWKNWKIQ